MDAKELMRKGREAAAKLNHVVEGQHVAPSGVIFAPCRRPRCGFEVQVVPHPAPTLTGSALGRLCGDV